ncbi:MAG: MFS transporter [Theionarchaea archaeon]|nr:MFS transporter [Theionarchaea archaeon]MBU7038120.1 MFS transporter [Theionarchaea archaeon]
MSAFLEIKKVWKLLSQSTNIPALLLAGGVSMVGAGFLNPIFAVYFVEQGISFRNLGIIFSLASLGSLVLRPFMGHTSDRYGRKKLIVGLSFLVSFLTPFYLAIRNALGLAVIHSARTVVSESSQPVLSAMLGDVAPEKGRATLFGFYSSVESIVYSAALFGGGAIISWGFGFRELFYITSACFFVSSLVLAFFLKETVERKEEKPLPASSATRFQRFIKSARTMALQKSTLGLMVYSFFFTFALRVYPVYVPLFATQVFGAGNELLGPIVAVSWITFAVVQPFGGWISDKLGKRKAFIGLGLTLIIVFNTAMAYSPTLIWMIVLWALIGVGDGMFRPVMSALIVDIVPAELRGTYFGTLGSVRGVASIVAPLIYGYAAELFNIRMTFQITSVCLVAAVLAAMLLIKEGMKIGE